MLAAKRRQLIIESVHQDGTVRVRELAGTLGVSDMTVRRDLDDLARRGLVEKVHGGATRVASLSADEPGFEAKQRRESDQKEAIARRAASYVQPGSTVGLTAGTTTWRLARHLLAISDLTVVTNAPSVAQVLYRSTRSDLSVVLTGGTRTPSDALVGPLTTTALGTLHLDIAFMGVHGMSQQHGYSTPNLLEAEVNRAFVRAARTLIVVADHTKWDTQGLATIAPLSVANTLISDDQLSRAGRDALTEAGVDLQIAT